MSAGRYIPVVFLVVLLGLVGWSLATRLGGSDDEHAGTAGTTAPGAGIQDGPLPASLAGLKLTAQLAGDAARVEVEQLHGKVLGAGLDQAWVGRYGDAGEATVWLTRSVKAGDAQGLLDRMADRIAEGRSPFHVVGPLSKDGVEGYELDGMGQKHYYFIIGPDLYWLAAAPALADLALAELVTHGTKGSDDTASRRPAWPQRPRLRLETRLAAAGR